MRACFRTSGCQFALGFLYPGIILLLGILPVFATWQSLPARISIHFDLARNPTLSLSKPVFVGAMAGIMCSALLVCVLAAVSGPLRSSLTAKTVVSYAGFVSAAAGSLMAGAVQIHAGLSRWDQAVGPGWWILIVIVAGLLGAKATVFLYQHSLKRG